MKRTLSTLARRDRVPWLLAWLAAASLPLVCIAVASHQEIATWMTAGTCPGGPMDRPAAPCGPLELFGIVFLGGWAAFIVVPTLATWWMLVTAGVLAVFRRKHGPGRKVA